MNLQIRIILKNYAFSLLCISIFSSYANSKEPSCYRYIRIINADLRVQIEDDVPFYNLPLMENVRPLGRGGHGEVTLVRDIVTDEVSVFKIDKLKSHDGKGVTREVKVLKSLNSPFFPRLLRHGEVIGYKYMETSFGVGNDLDDFILDGSKHYNQLLTKEDSLIVLKVLLDTLDAINHMHSKGWVHRDLKKKNLILNEGRLRFLIDYGASTRIDKEIYDNDMITPLYSAPEQFQLKPIQASIALDYYSLGSLIKEFLNKQLPRRLVRNSSGGETWLAD